MMTKGTITEFAEEISNLEEHGKCLFYSRDLCHSLCFLRYLHPPFFFFDLQLKVDRSCFLSRMKGRRLIYKLTAAILNKMLMTITIITLNQCSFHEEKRSQNVY